MDRKPLTITSDDQLHTQCDSLASQDQDLAAIVRTYGYPPRWSRPNNFAAFVHIILEQQVSLASAWAAIDKLEAACGGITPASVLRLDDAAMRAAYVSRQKAGYIRGLAHLSLEGGFDLERLAAMTDDQVRHKLLAIKGVGNWTVDIYLIEALGRPDIFPAGDIAARNSLATIKGLAKPSLAQMLDVSQSWQPYRTAATLLLWHHYLSSRGKSAPALLP